MRPLYLIYACVILSITVAQQVTDRVSSEGPSEDFIDRGQDGSYKFGYKNSDRGSHYHVAGATRDNTVSGSFGSRDPASGRVVQTTYTAGSRGFRARGPNVARQMDLSQAKIPYQPPVPPNSLDYQPTYDNYHDPNEDPSYKFTLKTPNYVRDESADSKGTVNGAFSYIDDVGKRHDVQYEAGSRTGFHVKTAFPDSEPYGGLFYRGPNKPGTLARGHSSIVQGTDGAYQFTATGPDQKRIEVSDSVGRVRGSYTYIDDKGVQRTVQYVAGPNIGYKVIRKGSGPVYSSVYPFPVTDFLVPPLPPESAISAITTTSSPAINDLFDPATSNFGIDTAEKSFGNANEFVRPIDKPSTMSSYQPRGSTELPNYWNTGTLQPTLEPPKPDAQDFFTGLNSNKPSADTPFHDISGDRSSTYDKNSGSEVRPYSTHEGSYYNGPKSPSDSYTYPKPHKSFNEESSGGFQGRSDDRYSDTNGNFLGLPAGVVVRAHVQSLDILPYGSRVPPPEETLRKHLFDGMRRDR